MPLSTVVRSLWPTTALAVTLLISSGCGQSPIEGDCPDSDDDGVCNVDDVCPAGDDKEDIDGDEIPDPCDLCAGLDVTGDTDSDGTCNNIDPDDDGDGCPDADDAAPLISDGDRDGDGLVGTCDPCPDHDGNDADDDGACGEVDCDDGDPDEFPGQTWYADCDDDGVRRATPVAACDLGAADLATPCGAGGPPAGGWSHDPPMTADCDDEDGANFPGNDPVIGNGADEDCDGDGYDECYLDADGDGFGVTTVVQDLGADGCAAANHEALTADDCDDGDVDEAPGQTWFADCDGDGTWRAAAVIACDREEADIATPCLGAGAPTGGWSIQDPAVDADCDDEDPNNYPGNLPTIADGADNDCDGAGLDECVVDEDDDGYGTNAASVVQDADASGCVAGINEADNADDCNDDPATGATVFPGNSSPAIIDDGVDNDCDAALLDECYRDQDADGFGTDLGTIVQDADASGCVAGANEADNADDCDDNPAGGAAVFPGNTDATIIDNGVDNDCDGSALDECYLDDDDDGFGVAIIVQDGDGTGCLDGGNEAGVAGDCDDAAGTGAEIYPGNSDPSITDNGVDNDCDGMAYDECFFDADNDGFGDDAAIVVQDSDASGCVAGANEAVAAGDCDDDPATGSAVFPGNNAAAIIDDGADNDCDGGGLDECWQDADDDGFGVATIVQDADASGCVAGANEALNTGDCDDNAATGGQVFPGNAALFIIDNGVDNDCDAGAYDECYFDADDDNYGAAAAIIIQDTDASGCLAGANEANIAGDCEDQANICTSDCVDTDGDLIWDCTDRCVDADNDGFGADAGPFCNGTACDPGIPCASGVIDCDETDPRVNPAGIEILGDGVDQDCDFRDLCFVDGDGDGFGSAVVVGDPANLLCFDSSGFAAVGGDCDDALGAINPVADEDCVNGADDDCDGRVDCFDDDCSADGSCGVGEALCADGLDDEADGFIDCRDRECACAPPTKELCSGAADEDGDGAVDCADPDCRLDPACNNPGEVACANGLDDDGDGFADCADADCFAGYGLGASWCTGGEICNDGGAVDEDGDGLTDCGDPDCAADPSCPGVVAEACDASDLDGDGLVDCLDPDCSNDAACSTGEAACADGLDDDGDGFADCADLDCAASCVELTCNDGLDDDGDQLVDCADDDCSVAGSPCSPGAPEAACADGIDDDADGFIDCADRDCVVAPECLPGVPASPLDAPADHLVISEVARGYTHSSCDYVELYNPTASPISVAAMSVQRQTPTLVTSVIDLAGFVAAHGFYLVGDDDWSSNNCDATGVMPDALGQLVIDQDNAVLLVDDQVAVAACDDADIVDRVGWGGHPCFETAPSIHPTTGSPIHRKAKMISNGITMDALGAHATAGNAEDRDNNSVDFVRPTTHTDPQDTGDPVEIP